jgi:hypothetical protein
MAAPSVPPPSIGAASPVPTPYDAAPPARTAATPDATAGAAIAAPPPTHVRGGLPSAGGLGEARSIDGPAPAAMRTRRPIVTARHASPAAAAIQRVRLHPIPGGAATQPSRGAVAARAAAAPAHSAVTDPGAAPAPNAGPAHSVAATSRSASALAGVPTPAAAVSAASAAARVALAAPVVPPSTGLVPAAGSVLARTPQPSVSRARPEPTRAAVLAAYRNAAPGPPPRAATAMLARAEAAPTPTATQPSPSPFSNPAPSAEPQSAHNGNAPRSAGADAPDLDALADYVLERLRHELRDGRERLGYLLDDIR